MTTPCTGGTTISTSWQVWERGLYAYLNQACAAALNGTAAPSLLPEHARVARHLPTAA